MKGPLPLLACGSAMEAVAGPCLRLCQDRPYAIDGTVSPSVPQLPDDLGKRVSILLRVTRSNTIASGYPSHHCRRRAYAMLLIDSMDGMRQIPQLH